jgi:hypothetical protein
VRRIPSWNLESMPLNGHTLIMENVMGFFSWTTSDSRKSIRNVRSIGCKTVYLLQPNGAPPIEEPAYNGYGVFGGVDAHVWLARMNLPKESLAGLTDSQLRSAGIDMDCGNLLRIKKDGKLYGVFHGASNIYKAMGIDVECFKGRWSDPIPAFGMSPNQMIDAGLAEAINVLSVYAIRYPLKFSFDRNAKYEDLPAAGTDPNQGFL